MWIKIDHAVTNNLYVYDCMWLKDLMFVLWNEKNKYKKYI